MLIFIYLAGMLATVAVQRHRVGISQMGRLDASLVFGSLPWVFSSIGKMAVWPGVLVYWLVQGRPESPWHCVSTPRGNMRVERA